MKKLLISGMLAAVAAAVLWAAPLRTSVTLAWDYPTDLLSTNLTFVLHSSTNMVYPLSSWAVLTNVVGTNLQVSVPMQPGVRYFYLTASNYWGESDPSNVAQTPAVPQSGVLNIK